MRRLLASQAVLPAEIIEVFVCRQVGIQGDILGCHTYLPADFGGFSIDVKAEDPDGPRADF